MNRALLLPLAAVAAGCTPAAADLPDAYSFAGRSGESSVSYSGQTMRQLLVQELRGAMDGLTERVDVDGEPFAEGDVVAELAFYMDFDGTTGGDVEISLETDPPLAQQTLGEVSTSADLAGKIAGNDEVGQHRAWTGGVPGWEDADSPEALVRGWFDTLDALAAARSDGTPAETAAGTTVPSAVVTAEGLHLSQLTQKYLWSAIHYSQVADDYLDDDTEGKGLLADHTALEEGETYTALEHAWDEGFGYWGAPRDLGDWTAEQIADGGGRDTFEPDGAIDLKSEYTWSLAGYAAQRDLGGPEATDFREDLWTAFRAGRQILDDADGALSDGELDALRAHRDTIVQTWERVIGANVIHYANDTLRDMGDMGTDDYDLVAHAAHWSELKAFALGFVYSPHAKLTGDDFDTLHELIGMAPVLQDADADARTAYEADLQAAKELVADVLDLPDANVGNEEGSDGW